MYTLTVNGVPHQTDGPEAHGLPAGGPAPDLRENGCGEGACGTCTILVDAKKVRACILTVAKADGKHITTVEGLTDREKQVYVHCFGETGAVQCGFCIPGMVISAKALLDTNLNPTRREVKAALKGNICRCTGYVKIEDAILMAAEFFRESKPVPQTHQDGKVGSLFTRVDAEEKVLGTGEYVDDMKLPGMIYAKALRSAYPRAKVKAVRLDKALAHPDVVKILTAADVPFNKTGHIVPDWDVLIAQDTTRYVGDAIVLAATRHRETLDEVLALVRWTTSPRLPHRSPGGHEARRALLHEGGQRPLRQELKRGDVDGAIACRLCGDPPLFTP